MKYNIPQKEREYLRKLAVKQAEIAALPIMKTRKKMWYDLNDEVKNARSPVIIAFGGFCDEFITPGLLKCETQIGKDIEKQLIKNIFNHEKINDDKVIPDFFNINWYVQIDHGFKVDTVNAKDQEGRSLGHEFIHPIKDIKRDIELLAPPTCSVNRERTFAQKEFLENLFGDLLSIRIQNLEFSEIMLTNTVIRLMGMETFFLAMYDAPDEIHQLMGYLRDSAIQIMRWAESEKLLVLNNSNQGSCFGVSYNFTNQLPARDIGDDSVKLCDIWGTSNSQETVGVSPDMFHEFCAPYYNDVCEPFGKIYFGCCEPVHPLWDDIKNIPHLKKVSIPKWCDEDFMGEALQGTSIVYSRKPDLNFLSLDLKLNEEEWAKHIRTTLEKTKGVAVEFLIRDVCTVHGDIDKVHRAIEIAKKEVEMFNG